MEYMNFVKLVSPELTKPNIIDVMPTILMGFAKSVEIPVKYCFKGGICFAFEPRLLECLLKEVKNIFSPRYIIYKEPINLTVLNAFGYKLITVAIPSTAKVVRKVIDVIIPSIVKLAPLTPNFAEFLDINAIEGPGESIKIYITKKYFKNSIQKITIFYLFLMNFFIYQ